MKGTTLLAATCGILSAPASGFIRPSVSVRQAGASPGSRNGVGSLKSQMTITVDSPPRPLLKPGQRVVRKKRAQAPSAPAVVDTSAAPVKRIKSHGDYLDALRENHKSLVVIKFFAPWCRSCKAMDLKYRRLAMEYESVKFYEVDVHESPDLKKALGVTAVPTVKLHAGSLGQVSSFSCGPRKVPELVRKMELCKDVPALAARVSKASGMMEMVAGEMDGRREAPSPTSDSWRAEQDLATEPLGIVKGLMEKLARQEDLSNALAEELNSFPIDTVL